jgi:hypothetical protein
MSTTNYFLASGKQLFVGQPFTDDSGNKYPDNWLALTTSTQQAAIGITATIVADPVPTPPPTLTAAELLALNKTIKSNEISLACQSQIYAGFVSTALGAAHTYPAKGKDQTNLSGSVVSSLLPGLPTTWTTPFWCEDNSTTPPTWTFAQHTVVQIQQVGTDGKNAIVAALIKNNTLQAQIATADATSLPTIVW